MNIEKLQEIYNSESTYRNTEAYILTKIDNSDKDLIYRFVKGKKMEPYTFYPSVKVLNNCENNVLVIFGIASLEMGFTPAPIKIGKLVISYYSQKILSNEIFFETDLKTIDNINIFEQFTSDFKNNSIFRAFTASRFFEFLNILNLCCPVFDSIYENKIWNGIKLLNEMLYKEKYELYLNALTDLKWHYRWTSRFSQSEGTIKNFHSELIVPNNEYIKYLIKNVINLEIYETDAYYTDLEIEQIGYEHLNKARILAFSNYEHPKYVLSLIRNYEKYPFNSIKIDVE